MSKSESILVVDDQCDVRNPLIKYLNLNGYRAYGAENALSARRKIKEKTFDIMVLDIMMPGEDGLSLCRHVQEAHKTPVILLTAMSDETDRIVGLEVGADDYLTKPFNPRELLARIKAVLRRTSSLPLRSVESQVKLYKFSNWTLDVKQRCLIGKDDIALALSSTEFSLLDALLKHPNTILSREELLDLAKGRDLIPFDRSIDNQISRLRKKLESDPRNPKIIKTAWGQGYILGVEITKC